MTRITKGTEVTFRFEGREENGVVLRVDPAHISGQFRLANVRFDDGTNCSVPLFRLSVR